MLIRKILIIIFFLTSSVFSKENKIYIKGIESASLVPVSLSKKIENLLVLSVIGIYTESNILSDDASISILKQGKISQSLGSNAEFLNYLTNSLQFQELITSNLQRNNSILQLSLQIIQLNQNNSELKIKNKVYLEFTESEVYYAIPEMVKALKDKNYLIAKNLLHPESEFKLDQLPISTISLGNLKPILFTAKDGLPVSFLEGVTEYTKKADENFINKKYIEASDEYLKIINSIYSLQDNTEKKITTITNNLQNRILVSNSALYTKLLEEKDAQIPKNLNSIDKESILNYFHLYLDLWKNYKSLPDYAKSEKIDSAFKQRTEGLMKVYLTRIETSGDEDYQSLKFKNALDKYQSIEPIWKNFIEYIDLINYQQQISNKISLTIKSGTAYVSGRTKGYLQFAESENSRSILEGSMKNKTSQLERKTMTIYFMNQAKYLIETQSNFLENDILINYNSLTKEINLDSEKLIFISPKNIALAPIRYIGNLIRGITDIFVFKFGYGLGVGGEFLIIGASPAVLSIELAEASTAYGIETESGKGSPLQDMHNSGAYFGFYGINSGTCYSIAVRFCGKAGNDSFKYNVKKYTTANINIALGPSVYIGTEFHRIPELFGSIFFQDWDLFDLKEKTRPKYKYFGLEQIETLEKK